MTTSSLEPALPIVPKLGQLDTEYQKRYHIAIGIIFFLISLGAFYLGSSEPLFQHFMIELYYIPVIIAAIAFGWKWGLFYALASSFLSLTTLYGLPDSVLNWSNYLSFSSIGRSGLFIFIGVTAGYVSEREKQRQKIYQEITQTLETLPTLVLAEDAQGWFDQVLEAADSLLRPKIIDTFSIMLISGEGDQLRIMAAKGLPQEIIRTTRHPIGEGIIGQVMRTLKPMVCQDFMNQFDAITFSGPEHKTVSSLHVPLISNGKAIGVMNVSSNSKTHPFNEKDLPLLVILSRAVSMTIEIADLQKGLKATYLQTIHSLARTIDVKDKYTYDHSEKVAKYALTLASQLHFTESEKEDLYAAALLHDIGKIGVPDSILSKNGKLTNEEYEEAKKHCVLGMKILEPLEQMKGVANLIVHHQERFDGTGYPDGLKGDEIPLGSRILTVVDTYHAMTSDRVYRKALSTKLAIEELKRNKGTQFDPKVVDIFLEIIKIDSSQPPEIIGNG